MLKAPGMARPLNNLGVCLAWGESSSPKKTEAALQLFEKALLLRQSRRFLEAETLGNIGKIYLEKEEYEIASDYYRKAIKVDPNYTKGHYDLIRPLVLMGNWQEAESIVDWLLKKENNKADYYNLKGLILLWQNRAEESIPYLKKALLLAPQESSILFNAGISLSMTGQSKKANYFLNLASQNCPEDMIVFLALIENNLKAGHVDDAKIYTDRLFKSFNLDEINSIINKLSTFYASAPVSEEIVAPWVKKSITDRIMQR
jgi:Tfp pilus assembly protein PilF